MDETRRPRAKQDRAPGKTQRPGILKKAEVENVEIQNEQ